MTTNDEIAAGINKLAVAQNESRVDIMNLAVAQKELAVAQKESRDDIRSLAVAQQKSQHDIHKLGVLYEATQDDIKKILEAVAGMQQYMVKLPTREEFDELKDDVKTIKSAVTDTSNQVHDHEKRITRLEVAT